ncbi:MAG: hypothetical protein ACR2P3_06185 [Geminicoccaceae bacterium]
MITFRSARCRLAAFLPFVISSMVIVQLAGCSTSQVDLAYDQSGRIEPVGPETGKMTLGHFSDRRGVDPNWVGEIVGKYYYPKTVLETREPVTLAVRRVIEQGAEIRGMLSTRGADAIYQLSGEVIRLDGMISRGTEAHAVINIRLTKRDGSKEVYREQHRIDLNEVRTGQSANVLEGLLEDALNQAIVEALDSPAFRDQLKAENDI